MEVQKLENDVFENIEAGAGKKACFPQENPPVGKRYLLLKHHVLRAMILEHG